MINLEEGRRLLTAIVFKGHAQDLEHPHSWNKSRRSAWQTWAVGNAPALLDEIESLREEKRRLEAQVRCGHSPWPCKCDYKGGMCG